MVPSPSLCTKINIHCCGGGVSRVQVRTWNTSSSGPSRDGAKPNSTSRKCCRSCAAVGCVCRDRWTEHHRSLDVYPTQPRLGGTARKGNLERTERLNILLMTWVLVSLDAHCSDHGFSFALKILSAVESSLGKRLPVDLYCLESQNWPLFTSFTASF